MRRNERMRRLKLQMQVSIDGVVGGERGHRFNWDEEVRQYSAKESDLCGR
jgi:hypothetical protein